MAWSFQREENDGFSTKIPEGKHRVRIENAERSVSKKGNDMLILTLAVNGFDELVYHYITFMPANPQITNRMLTEIFDSFSGIEEGNLNIQAWMGKTGACTIKHEEYNGNVNSKVGRFIPADKQGDLSPWAAEPSFEGFDTVVDGDVPF